jgi:thioesterase domain-containing protein
VRRVQPVGPYHFVGFSFGGLVAYEMALQLRQQGEEVELVGMLDTWQPSYMNLPALKGFGPSHAFAGIAKLYSHTRDLSLLSKFIFAGIKIRNRLFRLFYRYSVGRGQVSMAQHMKNVRELNKMAGIQYQVKAYDGKITLLRAEDELDNGLPLDLGWNAFARGGVDIHFFPGDHGQVLAEPNVSVVGDILSRCLARSRQRERLVI